MPRRKPGGVTLASDPLRRSLRALIQVGLVQGVIQLYNAFAAHPLTADQNAAIMVVATPLLAFVQNWMEDSPAVPLPALLKAPASGGVEPVPDPH
jgi:hypothetical protein